MRVLVADDDQSSQLIVRTMLRSLAHECRVVSDGSEAWDAYVEDSPDVVISDWLMPGLTGLELCAKVREHGEAAGRYTYFILLTAQDRQQDVVAGMRCGADDYLIKPLRLDDLEVRLIGACRVTALHGQLADQRRQLERLNRELEGLARLDALTGLGNRLALQEDLHALEARVERHGRGFAVALLDVDHFKAYNDCYGHLAGDQALRAVASALVAHARVDDLLFRFGGEEFLVLLPEEDLEGATAAIERMRAGVARLGIPHERNPPFGSITLSAGVAASGPGLHGGADEVLRAADAALYRAKQEGRNRVAVDA